MVEKVIKNLVKKTLRYCFSEEIEDLKKELKKVEFLKTKLAFQIDKTKRVQKTFEDVLSNFDCSVDVHTEKYSSSWAVISLQGQKSDYLKFIDLGNSDIRQIADFLRRFEKQNNIKVDADPSTYYHLKETLKF